MWAAFLTLNYWNYYLFAFQDNEKFHYDTVQRKVKYEVGYVAWWFAERLILNYGMPYN